MNRFWIKVQKKDTGCWEWIASKDRAGYGEFHLNGKTTKAHRVSFYIANPLVIMDELCVLHKCDNPACVNPDHLFLGTHADNVADKCQKGRNRFKAHHGSANGFAKLTEDEVREIRSLNGTLSQTRMAALFGVTQACISGIILNKGWKHVN